MRTVTFVNGSTVVTSGQLAAVVAALQRQVDEDFAPAWGIAAKLAIGPAAGEVIHVLDDSDQADALGYHDEDPQGHPVGFVFARTTMRDGQQWQVTASHELLEQLLDPYVFSTAVATWNHRPAAIALECGDPVEDDTYLIDGVPVSNFILPNWFGGPKIGPFDHLGRLKAPLTMTKGGYVAYTNDLRRWNQSFGPEHVHDHGAHTRPHRRQVRNKLSPIFSGVPQMSVPQQFTDAINKLSADADELSTAYADQASKKVSEALATQLRQTADNACTAGAAALEADKLAAKQLLESLFPSTPPATPATPAA